MSAAPDAPLLVIRFAIHRDGKPVLTLTRRDGSVAWQRQSHFFPVHDLGHFAIETTLGLREAFWGMMADGWEFADFGTPWPRGRMPNEPEAGLAEYTAGWFDRMHPGGEDDAFACELLNADLGMYFAQHGLPAPRVITTDEFTRMRTLRHELAARWHALAPGEAFELEFSI